MTGKPMADPNAYYGSPLAVAAYDLFAGRGMKGDIAFYLDCARRFGGPVLEIGAGTGRVLLPLAEAGHEVVGMDNSTAMLERAVARLAARPDLRDRVRLVETDMTGFDLVRDFALVIIAGRSFQHVTEPDAQRAALLAIRRHLRPGGTLILDLFDPNFELMLAAGPTHHASAEAIDPASGYLIRRTVAARSNDFAAQTTTETLLFQRLNREGAEIEREETSWTLRWSTRQETAYLLELCGFQPVEQYSDFLGSPPQYGREQLWVAQAVR
jgi:SAM-dependent methyltransferase